jgi:hypothetical protein
MLEILGTIVGSVFGGGATGILGVLAQRFFDYKNRQLDLDLKKLQFDHEAALRDKDAMIVRGEWAARTQIADISADATKDAGDSAAFAQSFGLEPRLYSEKVAPTVAQGWVFVILDFFRGIVRPGLTIYLCYLVTQVYNETQRLGVGLTSEQALDIFKLIIGTVLYVWTTCTLWWFGTRNKHLGREKK